MLHKETLEAYRKMTPGEKLKITLGMMRENARRIFGGDHELVERRFAAIQQQNDDRNKRMLTAIARTRDTNG